MASDQEQHSGSSSVLYDEDTHPGYSNMTAPISSFRLPPETWYQRTLRIIGSVIVVVVRKLNQLLSFALNLLLLILFVRFALTFFNIVSSSLFTRWIFGLSRPFIYPFQNFLPMLRYGGFRIDLTVLGAMLAYIILVALVRKFIQVLFARP